MLGISNNLSVDTTSFKLEQNKVKTEKVVLQENTQFSKSDTVTTSVKKGIVPTNIGGASAGAIVGLGLSAVAITKLSGKVGLPASVGIAATALIAGSVIGEKFAGPKTKSAVVGAISAGALIAKNSSNISDIAKGAAMGAVIGTLFAINFLDN